MCNVCVNIHLQWVHGSVTKVIGFVNALFVLGSCEKTLKKSRISLDACPVRAALCLCAIRNLCYLCLINARSTLFSTKHFLNLPLFSDEAGGCLLT